MKRRAVEKANPLQTIPPDVLGLILGGLSQQDACAARSTCVSWRGGRALWRKVDLAKLDLDCLASALAACQPPRVKEASLSGQQLEFLTPKFTALENLTLCKAEDDHLVHVATATKVRNLRIRWAIKLTDGALVHIAKLANLETLHLANVSKSTDAAIPYLASLTQLREFSMLSSGITDSGVKLLVDVARNLTVLRLASCDRLTDSGVAEIRSLPTLTDLDVSGCLGLTGMGFAHLEHLPIKFLNLRNCSLVNGALVHVSRLHRLQVLVLNGCEPITDAGLMHLTSLQRLLHLGVAWRPKITNASLAIFGSLLSLEYLDISGSKRVTDDGLKHLAQLSNLQVLKMAYCARITNDGLAHLVELSQLHTLIVRGCDFDDRACAHVAQLANLKEANFCFCKLTDAGVDLLCACEKLARVNVAGCDKVTLRTRAQTVFVY